MDTVLERVLPRLVKNIDNLQTLMSCGCYVYLNSIFFMFFTLIFGDNFLLMILVNCVRDESCREKLAPTSPSGSYIIDAAINSAHKCTL